MNADEQKMEAGKRWRTMQELAREALAVQDACNLSGVVSSFARALSDLWEHCAAGTEWVNTHPISIVWADKIAQLTGTQSFAANDSITAAYREVHRLAEYE